MLLPRPSSVFCVNRLRLVLGGACVAGFAFCAAAASAQQEQAANPGRSPFLPPDWEQRNSTEQKPQTPAQAQGAEQGGYTFNGLLTIGGRTYYSVSNEQTKQAYLLEMNDNSQGVQVTSYDPARNTVAISQPGAAAQELTLRKSDGEPLTTATSGRNTPGQSRLRPGGSGDMRNVSSVNVTDRGPSTAWLEARHRRLGEQIEMRRMADAQAAGEANNAGGSSTVRVGTASGTATAQPGASSMSAGSGERSSGDQGQTIRRRRLRLDTNAQ